MDFEVEILAQLKVHYFCTDFNFEKGNFTSVFTRFFEFGVLLVLLQSRRKSDILTSEFCRVGVV